MIFNIGIGYLYMSRKEFKFILKSVLILMLLFGFPISALLIGAVLGGSYILMDLMAVFPALKFVDFVLLAVPLAASQQIDLVQKICTLHTFKGKRKLLNALRRFR